jgi:hypothetical protein
MSGITLWEPSRITRISFFVLFSIKLSSATNSDDCKASVTRNSSVISASFTISTAVYVPQVVEFSFLELKEHIVLVFFYFSNFSF